MAEEREEKGFVVRDRRRVSLDETEKTPAGEAAGEAPKGAESPEERKPEAGPKESGENREHVPFPEVSLATFVFSLSSSALMHLGEIAEPETGQYLVDLPMAKQIIDTLGMLQDKTKGNLDQDEERLLRSILYDLRMKFVEKSNK
jgi:hypothetical protein